MVLYAIAELPPYDNEVAMKIENELSILGASVPWGVEVLTILAVFTWMLSGPAQLSR